MYTKTLSAIFLIAVVAQVHCGKLDLPSDVDKCLEKLNIGDDFAEKTTIEKLSKEDRNKFLCAVGCFIKSKFANEGIHSIAEYFTNGVTAAENADGPILLEKLNVCTKVGGNDECKFMQCLDKSGESWKSRIDSLILFLYQ